MGLRRGWTVTGLLALMGMASPAFAGNFQADCSGWSDTYVVYPSYPEVFTADVTLYREDASGQWIAVESSSDQDTVTPPDTDFALSGSWSTSLCGKYKAELVLRMDIICEEPSSQTFFGSAGPFECSCPPPPPPPSTGSPRTPGYWKTHPESWPTSSLSVGGRSYDQDCLIAAMDLPTGGDARVILIHHLVAAMLNLLPNANPDIGNGDPTIITNSPNAGATLADTIAAAHAALAGTTIQCDPIALSPSPPRGFERAYDLALKDALDAYNNGLLSSSTGLEAESTAGGCTAVGGAAPEAILLSLIALVVMRRRVRR